MEILRFYAATFVEFQGNFSLSIDVLTQRNIWDDHDHRRMLTLRLRQLREMCATGELPMTGLAADEILKSFEMMEEPQTSPADKQFLRTYADNWQLIQQLRTLSKRLIDELSTKLFFQLRSVKGEYFDTPQKGWEQIVDKYPDCMTDVEEMNRCFALSRYTASVFHAMHVAEWGAIQLGDKIGATSVKRGWGATKSELEKIIKAGHTAYSGAIAFADLEQINQEILTMSQAWRNKVDHAANTLVLLPNKDFVPDLSEHIAKSVRAFMTRLIEAGV